jgi:predicted RNA-binding protein with RPS1 domain
MLKKIIQKFENSQTSLDSYQAISDFVKIVKKYPEFINQIIEESEDIRLRRIELNNDKGLDLSYRDRKIHNQKRQRKEIALHQLDPMFPFQNLYNVFEGIKPKKINNNSFWLFSDFGPDDPLPKSDKQEYLVFLNKVYKKLNSFLNIEEKPNLGFDSDKSILYIQREEVKITLKNDKTNAHYILKHIFESGDLTEQFPYREISEDTLKDFEYKPMKFYRACKDIKEKVFKATQIDDFIEFSSGKTGWIKINKKYLE